MIPLSLIIFDVDFFKRYNDTYGHQAGDDCLKTIASVIQEDIKRASDLPARYGGEEFAVILPNTEISGALAIAESIRNHVRSLAIPHAKSHIDGRVTISAGVSCMVPAMGTFPDMLITWADKALYKAKASGRNLVKSSSIEQHASGKMPVLPGVQG